ncbi:hypothetical protein D3C87_694070 [compost metagenome]
MNLFITDYTYIHVVSVLIFRYFYIIRIQIFCDYVGMLKDNLMEKTATLIKRAAINIRQLDSIKIGDFLADEYGKSGKVCDIEIINRKGECHYYFKLLKSGTILIIV